MFELIFNGYFFYFTYLKTHIKSTIDKTQEARNTDCVEIKMRVCATQSWDIES